MLETGCFQRLLRFGNIPEIVNAMARTWSEVRVKKKQHTIWLQYRGQVAKCRMRIDHIFKYVQSERRVEFSSSGFGESRLANTPLQKADIRTGNQTGFERAQRLRSDVD